MTQICLLDMFRYIQIGLRTVSPQLLSALLCSTPILASRARLLQNFIITTHPRSNSVPHMLREPRDPQNSSERPPEVVVAMFTCGLHLAAPLSSRLLLSSRPSRRARNQINRGSNSILSQSPGMSRGALDLNVRTHGISWSSDTVPVSSLQDRSLCPRSSLWPLECISSRFWLQRFSCQYTFSFPQSGQLHEHLRDVICACAISSNILSHLFRLVSYMNIYGM